MQRTVKQWKRSYKQELVICWRPSLLPALYDSWLPLSITEREEKDPLHFVSFACCSPTLHYKLQIHSMQQQKLEHRQYSLSILNTTFTIAKELRMESSYISLIVICTLHKAIDRYATTTMEIQPKKAHQAKTRYRLI